MWLPAVKQREAQAPLPKLYPATCQVWMPIAGTKTRRPTGAIILPIFRHSPDVAIVCLFTAAAIDTTETTITIALLPPCLRGLPRLRHKLLTCRCPLNGQTVNSGHLFC